MPARVLVLRVGGGPGADATPFPDALYRCPGDEDLEHVLGPGELANALDATFRVVDGCLDRWTPAMLAEEIRRDFGDWKPVHTRGWILERGFAHDVYHCAELNEAFTTAGLPLVDLWE